MDTGISFFLNYETQEPAEVKVDDEHVVKFLSFTTSVDNDASFAVPVDQSGAAACQDASNDMTVNFLVLAKASSVVFKYTQKGKVMELKPKF